VGRTGRRLRRVGVAALLIIAALWVVNTSAFTSPGGPPKLLAHRGLAQTFDLEGVGGDTCTAELIHPPEHSYLENTIASMRAAFEAGADVVELDVQLTKDGRFAVFHDSDLGCRTEASGPLRDRTMEQLRQLDVGYGYTADGGRTYPFRGTGVGLMPELAEVFDAFPKQELLLNIKSNDPEEGTALAARLSELPGGRLEGLAVYGGDRPISALKQALPGVRVMSRATLTRCLGWYLAVGWTSYVPPDCENTQLHLPERYARLMWGWPHRFVDRMEEHGSRVVFVAGDGTWSDGFDSADDVDRLPEDFSGTVWTNRIDRIVRLLD
jgi:glycerophosphoryl diester phosphodiesterase